MWLVQKLVIMIKYSNLSVQSVKMPGLALWCVSVASPEI